MTKNQKREKRVQDITRAFRGVLTRSKAKSLEEELDQTNKT